MMKREKLQKLRKKLNQILLRHLPDLEQVELQWKMIKLMKSVVGDEVKVKAAGGIRDLKTALAMIEAGAERLGTSAGVANC